MNRLEWTEGYYGRQINEIREAKKEALIQALGQDIYRELSEAYQKGLRPLMDKIPEFFKWNADNLATRYLSIYEIFRHREGRCEEEAHFALGVLYLFDVEPLEYVISFADHVWLIVQGSHYDPGMKGEDRYDKTYYARNWKTNFSFMLAFDLAGNVRDVAAEYIEMTPEVMERRKKIKERHSL
ncbi:MAG: hypothetical protein HYV47_00030 [Candidatus Nealsonbacteria bacterium]|nr:hypothetical protein [Candidatus Nealsonbacteria bacterium]